MAMKPPLQFQKLPDLTVIKAAHLGYVNKLFSFVCSSHVRFSKPFILQAPSTMTITIIPLNKFIHTSHLRSNEHKKISLDFP